MSRVVPVPIFGQNSSSTAHVIDGSLHFTRSPVDLKRQNAVEGNRGAFHVILLGKKFNRIRLHLLTGCITCMFKFTSPTLVN